jgi:hypothetical protein
MALTEASCPVPASCKPSRRVIGYLREDRTAPAARLKEHQTKLRVVFMRVARAVK